MTVGIEGDTVEDEEFQFRAQKLLSAMPVGLEIGLGFLAT